MDAVCADDHIAFFDGAVGEVDTHSCFSVFDLFKTLACLDSGLVWEAFVEMGHACLAVEQDVGHLEAAAVSAFLTISY